MVNAGYHYFGAETRVTLDVFNFHNPFADFGHFHLEQFFHKFGAGAGQNNVRPTLAFIHFERGRFVAGKHRVITHVGQVVLVQHFGNNGFYAGAVYIAFFFNLFAVRQNGFHFAQVHNNIPVGKSPHGAGNYFAFAGFEFFIKVVAFNAAHFLDKHLFGNLRRNAGKVFHVQRVGDDVAHFGVFGVGFGLFHVQFRFRVGDGFHHR